MNIINDKRPWGSFRQFTHNEISTVKILSVNVASRLSLQYHEKREEFWRVLSGNPIVVIGEKTIKASPGDEFFIAKKAKHRIEGKENDAQILEISFGDFDENDVVRLADDFGRT
jgi:mannose-6-phosphate isomerase-like protein (cupin superfamily)